MWSSDECRQPSLPPAFQARYGKPWSEIRASKPLPAMSGKVGSDWLPARPWTGGGVPMDTVTIGVEGSAHLSKRAYLAISASPVPYAFFGKVENCKGQAEHEVGELEAARL